MRKLMLASTVLLLIVGQTMAASTVFMELEVGGSNNGATCSNRVFFTPGSNLDGTVLQLDQNGHMTWAVRLKATGTHLNASGQAVEIRGVANYVFDLELYANSVAPQNLVQTATFTSTANMGGSCGNESDPTKNPTVQFLSNAAFPYTFTISNYGPALRIFDVYKDPANVGGPRVDVHCYPKAAAGTGKLFGMGAGYSSWTRSTAVNTNTFGGIGKGDRPTPNVYPTPALPGCVGDPSANVGCLGWGPVAEGQLEGLAPGTYVLKLIPGGGINVLRNEVGTASRDVFAVAADTASGDEITFVVQDIIPPEIHILGWSSVRTCGGVEAAVPLNAAAILNSEVTSEPRGDVVMIKVDYDQDISANHVPGNVVLTPGLSVASETVSADKTSVLIGIAGATDGACYDINVANCVTGVVPGEYVACKVRALRGDVNSDAIVNVGDMLFAKSKIGQPAAGNELFDVNCDGFINVGDMLLAKSAIGQSATCE